MFGILAAIGAPVPNPKSITFLLRFFINRLRSLVTGVSHTMLSMMPSNAHERRHACCMRIARQWVMQLVVRRAARCSTWKREEGRVIGLQRPPIGAVLGANCSYVYEGAHTLGSNPTCKHAT